MNEIFFHIKSSYSEYLLKIHKWNHFFKKSCILICIFTKQLLGWCKWYEFSDADLRTAIDFLSLMEKSISNQMEWAVLRGLYLNIAYGGTIDNIQDLTVSNNKINFFN